MRTVYIIFATVGWAWCAVALGYLWWRVRRDRDGRREPRNRGFEVLRPDAQ